MAENTDGAAKVREIIEDTRIALLTHIDGAGRLVSKPMFTQQVEFDGTVRFIIEASSDQARQLQHQPAVNVAYAGDGAWVSLAGTARVVDDLPKLKQLWDTFTDAWLEGGPENPENVLLEIDAETAEYWDAPGPSKLAQVVNLVKTKVTGQRAEGENEIVDL